MMYLRTFGSLHVRRLACQHDSLHKCWSIGYDLLVSSLGIQVPLRYFVQTLVLVRPMTQAIMLRRKEPTTRVDSLRVQCLPIGDGIYKSSNHDYRYHGVELRGAIESTGNRISQHTALPCRRRSAVSETGRTSSSPCSISLFPRVDHSFHLLVHLVAQPYGRCSAKRSCGLGW